MKKVSKNTWLFRLYYNGLNDYSKLDRILNDLIDDVYASGKPIESSMSANYEIWYKLSDNLYVDRLLQELRSSKYNSPRDKCQINVCRSTLTRFRQLLVWSDELELEIKTNTFLNKILEESND